MSSKCLKEFKNADQIIEILSSRGMIFSQPLVAKKTLNETNYFFLKGYQELLFSQNNKYKEGCDFNELTNLYFFDKKLKSLLLEYLLCLEQKIKASLSNVISSKYGVKESDYLQIKNYDQNNPYVKSTLNVIENQIKIYGQQNKAIKHYKKHYGYIPFYVLSKSLTFGAIKNIFNVMKQADQDRICNTILCKSITKKKISKTKQMIALIADVRNMCAHDEIVFNFAHARIDIGELEEHKKFILKKSKKGELIQGRKDLFALLLCMKYFMNKTDYSEMIQRLSFLINKTVLKTKVYTKEELLDVMHLPIDFERVEYL